ncbi:uncharacterized protein GIQ15_06396 [Arthroderma uncinatum]|uniref:uncharacterized protein n=1 Tax=Arthroderma uncinatum TaxID=74035 RepID=UPI00144AA254|nr:uncharacterized protein GIQ15_06396 [Arthroderma uncinatum]KAF3479420.1 hypothetical protein GIQ15_06396 [Arthroderma uncinatum]
MEFYPKAAQVIPRPKPMKVLVLGLPRTGTTSICAALTLLGLNPYHYNEVVKNNENDHFRLWMKAVQAKYDGIGEPFEGADFDRMLWNNDAVSDDPCCFFVEELIAAYPEAKVVLTTRPSDAWLKSMQKLILEILSWRSWGALCFFDREFSAPYQALLNRTTSILSKGLPPCEPSSYPTLIRSFEEHNERVRSAVPKEQLLEFRADQGWGPLCEFIGVPVPECPYPHLNSGPEAMQLEKSLYWSRWYWVAQQLGMKMGMTVLVLVAALWFASIS